MDESLSQTMTQDFRLKAEATGEVDIQIAREEDPLDAGRSTREDLFSSACK